MATNPPLDHLRRYCEQDSTTTRAFAIVARADILTRNAVPHGDSQWKHLMREIKELPVLTSQLYCYEEIAALLFGRAE